MIRIEQLKLPVTHTKEDLENKVRRLLNLPDTPLSGENTKGKGVSGTKESPAFSIQVVRQSIDARKKPEIFFVYTVDVSCAQEKKILKENKRKTVSYVSPKEYRFPAFDENKAANQTCERDLQKPAGENLVPASIAKGRFPLQAPPVIVGTGPAGLFCGLCLARAGYRPILLERGEAVEDRQLSVETFWKSGKLNLNSNVQFGEGGAGTFSDGKLNTMVKDPDGRIRFVLKTFVEAGANPDILYSWKPHIGTDVLSRVVRHIREEICALGGQVLFGVRLTDIEQDPGGGYRLLLDTSQSRNKGELSALPTFTGASCSLRGFGDAQKEAVLRTKVCVLAIGHSARDTFFMLEKRKFSLQAKAFAVGVRIEHPQEWINAAMYGRDCPYFLLPAPYKLTHRLADGRGVYSFCMCPGGYVVNASSEAGYLAVNGMSYSSRDGQNANSAIVVTVSPEDFGDSSALSGLAFQRKLERIAFLAGGGKIPLQRFADFQKRQASTCLGEVSPQVRGSYALANVRGIFPDHIAGSIEEGICSFDTKIPGFAHPDALVSGVESRTSSPVRILRGETMEAVGFEGIYPCGEGAGYAGGITSAALDGIRAAEAVAGKFSIDFL